ncbi:MAG TPA: endonuclease/exonuclease/phosphatase family protein [Candidatus Saccharimonadales bacterium]|nr:endonuclease/exonuclease/phosphatase family protein [Candidatus Saccharimonadales bacterium]
MPLTVAAWNVRDAFSEAYPTVNVLSEFRQLNPDVAVISEAYAEGKTTLVDGVLEAFDAQGYHVTDVPYNDDDGREDRHNMIVLARKEFVASTAPIRLATRTAVALTLRHPDTKREIDLYGVHLDDRHEERRLGQATTLLADVDPNTPTVIAGKFNALDRTDPDARKLRMVAPLTKLLPSKDPAPGGRRSPIFPRRFGSLAQRLTEMADGGTMAVFDEAGFTDADSQHLPTKGRFHLDRILLSDGLKIQNGTFHSKTVNGFDNSLISATVRPF